MLNHTYGFNVLLLLLLLLMSCTGQTLVNSAPTSVFGDQPMDDIIKEIESDPFFQQFRTDVAQRNIELTAPGISRVAWLNAAPGVGYRVGRYWMNIHLYPDAVSAQENANQIPGNAADMTASWIAPPHFFLCDRIIVLYLGTDEIVLTALTELCGSRFSGFSQ